MKIFQNGFLTKYFIVAVLALGASSAFSQVSISVNLAPPPLQVYSQPACPDDGYLWTPGYWAYDNNAYYWVPGAWVQPPEVGMFWTPPYWGWDGNAYVFNAGYWGPNVGYYGGIDYGYGYGGHGYRGGRWEGGHFSYNTAVNNVNSAHVHHTYADRTAISHGTNKVSYNGGKGGVRVQPTAQERKVSNGRHMAPTSTGPAPVRATSQGQSHAADASFTGESAKPHVKPQPKESRPPTAQPPTQHKTEPSRELTQAQHPAQKQPQAAPHQPTHPQGQPQPKPAAHPSPQAHDKAAQPEKKSDNANAPGH